MRQVLLVVSYAFRTDSGLGYEEFREKQNRMLINRAGIAHVPVFLLQLVKEEALSNQSICAEMRRLFVANHLRLSSLTRVSSSH